jgi:hypothetical protein
MTILTLAQLRQFKGFENINDNEGVSIINSLYEFSLLAFNFFYKPRVIHE